MPDTIIITPSPAVSVTVTPAAVTANTPGTITVSPVTSSNTLVVSPIINTGTPTGPIIGIDQSLLAIAQSQVAGLVTVLTTKAPLASPEFTGVPLAPTATAGTNTTQIATTEFVRTAVSNLVDSAPGTLDTLNELAAALGDDASFATTVTTSLAGKANLAGGNALTGAQTITASAIGQVPLTLVGASGQTANLLSTAGGARIPAAGNYFIAPGISATFVADFNAGNATTTPVTINGASGQTANLLRLAVEGSDQATISASGILSANGAYISQVFAGSGISGGTLGRLNVAPFSAGQVGAVIRGAASQTANLFELQNSSATVLTNFNASGKLGIGTGTNASLGDLDVWAGTPSLNIVSTTFKSTGPKSAGILNWRSGGSTGERSAPVAAIEGFDEYAGFGYEGSLRFSTLLGATLTEKARITNIGSFLVNATTPVLATGNTLNTQLGVISANATTVGAVVRGASGQTANLLEIQSNASATLVQVTAGGSIQSSANVTAGTLTALARLTVVNGDANTVGAIIRAASGQVSNLLTWQTSGGSDLSRVSANGSIATGGNLAVGSTGITNSNQFQVTSTSATNIGAVIRGASGQTADLVQFQESGGGAPSQINATGQFRIRSFAQSFGFTALGVAAGAATEIPVIIRGAASQSANLQEWQNSAGTVLASITSAGLVSGIAADATLANAVTGLGYMGLPQNSTTTGAYTIVAGDAGKHVYASATRTVTIPANSALALPIGTTLTFIAAVGATMTIAITTDTMYLAGAGTTGSRTLAAHGIATAVKTTATTWLISGNGLT